MSDFTPSLDEVRAIYALGTPAHHVSIGGAYAEFDRVIEQVRADAKREALIETADWLTDMASGYLRESPRLLAGREIIAQIRAQAAGL